MSQTISPVTQLVIPSPEALRKELALAEFAHTSLTPDDARELSARASQLVQKLLSFKAHQTREQDEVRIAADTMGMEVQKRAAKHAELLRQPVKTLSQRSADGSDIANALISLKARITELDPERSENEPGFFKRTLGWIPGVGRQTQRYFTRLENGQAAIAEDTRSLQKGLEQLSRDNVTLADYQKQLLGMAQKLEQAIGLGQLMDQMIQHERDRETEKDDLRSRFVDEVLLPSLRQRTLDLKHQHSVVHQGVLTLEIIIRNNQELIRGASDALKLTSGALEVAGKVRALELHQTANSGPHNLASMKSAFAEIVTTLDHVSSFRTGARSQMASSLIQLDQASVEAEKIILRLEKGDQVRPEFKIDVL